MKICVRSGHNPQATGANGIISELTEDRKVKDAVIKYLRASGNTVIDGTPGNCDQNTDLNFGTNTANNNKVDLFLPIHLNSCGTVNTAVGTEVWLNPSNATGKAIGNRICSNLHALGFINRGLKDGVNFEHLHDIKASNMTAVLVEVCFVNSPQDVAIYKKLGFDKVGKSIAEAITGKAIQSIAPVVAPIVPKPITTNTPIKQGENSRRVSLLQSILNVIFTGSIKVIDGDFGSITLAVVIRYQKAMRLTADGIIGPATITMLIADMKNNYFKL